MSVNQGFSTSDGTYTLVMSGLKPENKDAIISALEEHYDPGATEGPVLVDNAFPDAEKYNSDSSITGFGGGLREVLGGHRRPEQKRTDL